ncbi:MAG: tyrosine-type recombinase/integrase [Pseudomonadota bacterium]
MRSAKPKKSKNPNRPAPGSSIKVEPIRNLKGIKQIKKLLKDSPRDLCLFTFGINTAYRAGELLSIRVGQVAHLKPGEVLDLKQSKNKAYRATTLNGAVIKAVQHWLEHHPDPRPKAPLFPSRKGIGALGVSALNHMIKKWCAEAGIKGNYGSHSLRKTFGYHQRVQAGQPVALLMAVFGHSSERVTLEYLGIQPDEIADLYMELEL